MTATFQSIRKYQEFFLAFTWRNIRLQYNVFWLGLFWGVVQPLLMSGIFYIALNKGIGSNFTYYFLYIYSGFIFWSVFSGSLSQAHISFIQNDSLVKNIYFPRAILPLTFLSAKLIDLLITFMILISLVLVSEIKIHLEAFILFSFLGVVQLLFVSAGCIFFFSTISVRFRGFQVVYPFVSQAIFFTSSIIYDISYSVENKWLMKIFSLNPITTIINTFRLAIFPEEVHLEYIILNTLYAVAIGFIGFLWFRMEDKNLIDRL